jgi:hypothetical protein
LEAEGFTVVPGVLEILRTYGGLRVMERGPGVECARSPFCLEPMLASGETERFKRYEPVVGGSLFPLGEVADGLAFLALGSAGAIYLVGDGVAHVADSFEEA